MKQEIRVPILGWVIVTIEDNGQPHRAARIAREQVERYGVAGGRLDNDIEIDPKRQAVFKP